MLVALSEHRHEQDRSRKLSASKLPEDLRPAGDPNASVTVTIEEEKRPEHVMSLEEIFALKGFRRRTAEEIDADIRQQRDERDD